MGCKAITPHLVGLARKLEGKPFHLVASHCQNNPKEEVLAYITGQGLSPNTPNVTVCRQGRHPNVVGNGHVPYYAVFDHHGDLVHHHMCGAYHGGDGLAMIDLVEKLLAAAPAVYLGRAPFEHAAKLARSVGAGKKLGAAWTAVESRLQESPSDAERVELERLKSAMIRHRDAELREVDRLLASDPAAVVPHLKTLSKDLAKSTLGAPVDERLAALEDSPELAEGIVLAKVLEKVSRSIEKLKACKSCRRSGVKTHQAGCEGCREDNAKLVSKHVGKLAKALEGREALPVAERAKAFIAAHR